MSKLLNLLKKNKMTLIVQLAENTPDAARAAEAGGAEALLIEKSEKQEEILKAVKIPIGLDLSQEVKLTEKELKACEKFDFIDFHFEVLPIIAKQVKTGRVLALNENYTLDKLLGVESVGAQAIDAAIVPLSQGMRELMVGDLQNYITIALSSNLPVIIPTQRSIKPSEVAIISDTGAKGLLLTREVLGENLKTLEKALKEYRVAVDDLGV